MSLALPSLVKTMSETVPSSVWPHPRRNRVFCKHEALITLFRRTPWGLNTATSPRYIMSSNLALSGSQGFHCLPSTLAPFFPLKTNEITGKTKAWHVAQRRNWHILFVGMAFANSLHLLTLQCFFSSKFRGFLI